MPDLNLPIPGLLHDAWRTLGPERDSRHGPLPPILLTLTVVTGFVDAYSYLMLGHVFVANMTGNVVFSGFAIAGAVGFSLPASLTALAAFACGAGLGGRSARSHSEHRGRLLYRALLAETAIVLAAYLLAQLGPDASRNAAVKYLLITALGLTMGVQNATARALAVPDLTTSVLTMVITGASADSKAAGGSGAHLARRLLAIAAMFLGAFVGTLTVRQGHPGLALLCAAILLAAAALAAARTTRSDSTWTRPS